VRRSSLIPPSLVFSLILSAAPVHATPIQIYGVWHAGKDACTWASVRDLNEFDQMNHWIVDRGDGNPSVNLAILSFVHPLRLLARTTDAQTVNGLPIGMTPQIVNYFKSRNIRVMLSIGGITYVTPWEQALAQNATQLGWNAAAAAQDLGVGIEIDYEGSSAAAIDSLQSFINAYRALLPYDASGSNPAARLTIDLAAGDRWLIALAERATREWLDPAHPVLDYANAMVPSKQPAASAAMSNWQEHVDGKPQYNPPILPLAPCKFTGSLFLTGHGVSAECNDFTGSVQYATRDFVENVAPNGAGTSSGMLGFMFWAAECEGTRTTCTTPPNTCENGIGQGSQYFSIPVPLPPLRQDNSTVAVAPAPPPAFGFRIHASNPFGGSTTFELSLPEAAHVDLRAFDAAGREVSRLAAGDFLAGSHFVPWLGRGPAGEALPAGTYFCRVRVRTLAQALDRTLRVTLLR
jgi:hypothetical protein